MANQVSMSIRLSPEMLEELKRWSEITGVPQSKLVRQALGLLFLTLEHQQKTLNRVSQQ